MGRIEAATTDTGPLIHLSELRKQVILSQLIRSILTTEEVMSELSPVQQQQWKQYLTIRPLDGRSKDLSKFLIGQFELHLGEATAIALAKSEKIRLFLTDDLTARITAKHFGMVPHGTIGLLMRAFREGIFSKEEAIALLHELRQTSLYLTSDLLQYAIRQIERYGQR